MCEPQQGKETTAARFSVPWISLVTESDARLVLRSVKQFEREGTVPGGYFEVNGTSLVTSEEALARYEACGTWFDTSNLLVVANGPYQLTRYDPPAQFAQLDAFRDPSYPFTVEDYRFGPIPTITIEPIGSLTAVLGDAIAVPVTVTGNGDLSLPASFL